MMKINYFLTMFLLTSLVYEHCLGDSTTGQNIFSSDIKIESAKNSKVELSIPKKINLNTIFQLSKAQTNCSIKEKTKLFKKFSSLSNWSEAELFSKRCLEHLMSKYDITELLKRYKTTNISINPVQAGILVKRIHDKNVDKIVLKQILLLLKDSLNDVTSFKKRGFWIKKEMVILKSPNDSSKVLKTIKMVGIGTSGMAEDSGDPYLDEITIDILQQMSDFMKIKFNHHVGWVKKDFFLTDSVLVFGHGQSIPRGRTIIPFEGHGTVINKGERFYRYQFSSYSPANNLVVDIDSSTGKIIEIYVFSEKLKSPKQVFVSYTQHTGKSNNCIQPNRIYSAGFYSSNLGLKEGKTAYFVGRAADCRY